MLIFLTSFQKAPAVRALLAKDVKSSTFFHSFQLLTAVVVLLKGLAKLASLVPAPAKKFLALLILDKLASALLILVTFLAALNKAPGIFAILDAVSVTPPIIAPGIAPRPPSKAPTVAPTKTPSTKPSVKIPAE